MGMGALRPLPPNTAPTGTRCIQITIPDDDEWERDLYSVITELGQWPRWARDEAHSATLVARRWRAALRTFRYCDGTTNPAIIEEFEDEMALCDQFRYHNGKLQVMCCGDWQDIDGQDTGDGPPTHEIPRDPRPAPTESNCYNLALDAKKQIRLPFPVSDGDVITISNAQGSWDDGNMVGYFCPSGGASVYENCFGAGALDGGDPASAVVHMRLVFSVGATWFDGFNTTTTLSGIGTNQQLTLQANDGTLGDNTGGVTFKMCVQNGTTPPPAEWCYLMDFTISDYAITVGSIDGNPEGGTYVPGVGFQPTVVGSTDNCSIWMMLPPGTYTYWSVETNVIADGIFVDQYNFTQGDAPGTAVLTRTSAPVGVSVSVYGHDIDQNAVSIECTRNTDGDTFTITQMLFRGTGDNPFGADNC